MAAVTPLEELQEDGLKKADADDVGAEDAATPSSRPVAAAPPIASPPFDLRDDVPPSAISGLATAPRSERATMAASGGPEREAGIGVQEQKLAQAAFDRLSEESTRQRKSKKQSASVSNIGRVDELRLDRAFVTDQAPVQARRPLPRFKQRVEYGATRREQSAVPSAAEPPRLSRSVELGPEVVGASPSLVHIFESEVDPFEFGILGSDHFVLYRKVWREGQRYIQGALIEKATLLRELVETSYRDTALAGMSRLGIVFDGEILSALGGRGAGGYRSSIAELSGTLLYRGRLSTPMDQLELIFSVTRMPTGSGGGLVVWVALTLGLVLSGGLVLLYRLGIKQIELNRQQRDFVSAVSHELKTPLTSIRMYSEMLREGWADEARRRNYYDFIHDESERLSRLIANVLQLARMSRGELKVEPRPVAVAQLIDVIRSKVTPQISQAGFEWTLECTEQAAQQILAVDDDAFVQILINLVDNAIKFSSQADEKLIEIGCDCMRDGRVEFAVRDHGPGIAKDQMKKIFTLFYRAENELTRETVGTGIGLALVHRLATAMGGEVEVANRDPGAEFRIRFPALKRQ